jgi:DTW domain-containing protein YfiP
MRVATLLAQTMTLAMTACCYKTAAPGVSALVSRQTRSARRASTRLTATRRLTGGAYRSLFEASCLQSVQQTVDRVIRDYPSNVEVDGLPLAEREAVSIARILQDRLERMQRNCNCPRCWMQQAHCICEHCAPIYTRENDRGVNAITDDNNGISNVVLSSSPRFELNRLFLLMHHKEVALLVDTAKLLPMAFPDHCRLVIPGIPSLYQDSMQELEQVLQDEIDSTLVLFPSTDAQTWSQWQASDETVNKTRKYNLIVLDGTWDQARRIHRRLVPDYAQGGPRRIQLSTDALAHVASGGDYSGRQLRRHVIPWREISTVEAVRLALCDLDTTQRQTWNKLADYQVRANAVAKTQLGAVRQREKHE